MGNAALARRKITTWGGKIHGRHARPEHPHGHLGIKIESAGASRPRERPLQGRRWINAKPEKWVVNARTEDFQPRQPHAQLAAVQTFQGHFRPENWAAEHERGGLRRRGRHEWLYVIHRMLSVRIERQHVREA